MKTMSSIEKIKESIGWVEVTSYEKMIIYQKYFQNEPTAIQDMDGSLLCIGKIDNREIWISVTFYEYFGKLICFCEATSELVDWKMIEQFFKNISPQIKHYYAEDFCNLAWRCQGLT